MKWNPSNFEESLLPYTFFCRLTCARVSDWFKASYKIPLVAIHILIVTVCRTWTSLYQWLVSGEFVIVSLAASLLTAATIIHFIGIMLMHLTNIYFTKSYIMFISKMTKIDDTLAILGAPVNHRKNLCNCCQLLVIIIVLSILMLLIHILVFLPYVTFWHMICMSLMTCVRFISDLVLILDFCVSVRSVGVRFEAINDFLIKLASNMAGSEIYPNGIRSIEDLNAWCIFVSRPRRDTKQFLHAVHTVKQVHLQLGRETAGLCKIYAIQITVAICMSITFSTTIAYNFYVKVIGTHSSIMVTVPEMLASILFCVAVMFTVIVINSSCEETVQQVEKMKSLIHTLHGASIDTELRNEVQQLALEIALRPLMFKIFGYNLNYFFVRSYFGTVLTYLLISIQLGG